VSALVASAQSFGTVANGGNTAGFVTVTSCGQHWLVVPQCRGDFTVANPGGPADSQLSNGGAVPLANDIRLHQTGARVQASLNTTTGRAYVSGAFPIFVGVIAILVVVFVLVATYATLSRVARRHQVVLFGPILTFVLAAGLAALLIVPFGDHTPQPSGAPALVATP
jgi:hypothetical protein